MDNGLRFVNYFVSLHGISSKTVYSLAPSFSINVGGELLSLDTPIVMGVLNATPDSFYQHDEGADAICLHARRMLAEGATILDVGACSTRPGSTPPDEKEEMRRLREALTAVRSEAPDAIVSIDTFRAQVARMCVEEFGAEMVNDISSGELDKEMWQTVADLGVPYVLTHNTAIDETEEAPFMAKLLRDMGSRVEALHELGVCDIIIDPGFGFTKTHARTRIAAPRRHQPQEHDIQTAGNDARRGSQRNDRPQHHRPLERRPHPPRPRSEGSKGVHYNY